VFSSTFPINLCTRLSRPASVAVLGAEGSPSSFFTKVLAAVRAATRTARAKGVRPKRLGLGGGVREEEESTLLEQDSLDQASYGKIPINLIAS
jgi:hypothetical protein